MHKKVISIRGIRNSFYFTKINSEMLHNLINLSSLSFYDKFLKLFYYILKDIW